MPEDIDADAVRTAEKVAAAQRRADGIADAPVPQAAAPVEATADDGDQTTR